MYVIVARMAVVEDSSADSEDEVQEKIVNLREEEQREDKK